MAGWATIWILEEPLWLLALVVIIPTIFYLSRRPTLEVKLPWGFLCPPVHADHQPSRRGKLNWPVFIIGSLGSILLVLLLCSPRSSMGKVFLFQPHWLGGLNPKGQEAWIDKLTSKWPEGISPAFYTFSSGPLDLKELPSNFEELIFTDRPLFHPEDFSVRAHPPIQNKPPFKGDLVYPFRSEVSIHQMSRLNHESILLQLRAPKGVSPQLKFNEQSLSPSSKDKGLFSYVIQLSKNSPTSVEVFLPTGNPLPSLSLPKTISSNGLPKLTHDLSNHRPLLEAYKTIPWISPPPIPKKDKGSGSFFKVSSEGMNTPSGLPLQAVSSSKLSNLDEHLGFNWPLLAFPNQVLPKTDDLSLFTIGGQTIVSRQKGSPLPWTMSFNPLTEKIFTDNMETYFWQLLFMNAFPRNWTHTPIQPDSPPLTTPDGKPQEVFPFPRFIFWFLGITLLGVAILLHQSTIARLTRALPSE